MRLGLLVALMLIAAVAPGGEALAHASATPGPVSPALISWLNSAGTEFRLASPGAHPHVPERAAVTHAVREAPWRHMTATGISLIRLTQAAIDAPVGSLAWLMSLEPDRAGGPAPPGAPTSPTSPTSPTADYFVVAVTATTGRLIAAAHGYSSPMPQ